MTVLALFLCLLSPIQSFSTKSRETTLKVEWIPSDSKVFPKRSGHVAWTNKDKTTIHIFGGYAEDESKSRHVVNDLWRYRDASWSRLNPTGDIPGPRLVSAGALLTNDDAYFLFGGWDPQLAGTGGVILDNVYKLDVGKAEWTKLAITLPDGPTSRHVVVALSDGNRALLHNHRCTDHVLLFDAQQEQFITVPTTGDAPSARGLHAACAMGKDVIVFGGAAQSGTMSNEAFVLDTETWRWTRIALRGDGPTPRAAPCLVGYSDKCAILFGGAEATETGLNARGDVWALHVDEDKQNGNWELLWDDMAGPSKGQPPPPRNAASLCEINQDGTSRSYLLTGGWAPFRETWDEDFVLRISTANS